MQSAERQPTARRGRDAANPRADPPQVRFLDAHAAAPARALAPRLVAEVPARRPDAVLTSSSGVFRLTSEYSPRGDQPPAIAGLTRFVREGRRHVVLRGVTGSGKTYTIANLIASAGRPTLVISPNKTLAAQLFSEFRAFFPSNAVEYFVSYYDYYQPEAYIPQSDTYIEKDALINDEIDRMRHSATKSLLERRDVLVVASVSCIYGIGEPDTYQGLHLELGEGDRIDRDEIIRRLIAVQYERNDYDFHRGTFRVRGDVVEVFPANEESIALRIELFGDVIDAISRIDPLRGAVLERLDRVHIYPASHYVTEASQLARAFETIQEELRERLAFLRQRNRLLEAQRLEQRTLFDMEMLRELGYCHGIENYSRHLTGRKPGEAPPTLIEYLPKDALIIIDESHVAVPQIRGMYYGDRSRKEALVEYGFRMPSAFDNRPLIFDEFSRLTSQTIYVSATPGAYELKLAGDALGEQVIRPTGLMDSRITVRPAKEQVVDLILGRPHGDARVHEPGRADHLLAQRVARELELVGARRGRDVDGLAGQPRELVEDERTVVERGGHPEAVLDQRFLARPVAVVHAADLGYRHVALVDDDQGVLRQVLDQRRRRLAWLPARQVARVVLDPVAVAELAQHLHVEERSLLEPLRLQQAVALAQERQPLAQLLLDGLERSRELGRLGDVVARRVDVDPIEALEHRAAQRVDPGDRVDHVAEELDPERDRLLVGREDLDDVTPHSEGPAVEVVVVPLVLDGDQAPDDLVAVDPVALAELEVQPLIGVGLADAVDARDGRDHQDVAALEERLGRRVAHPVDLVVDQRVLLDVGVRLRDVRLGLVVVVVRDEVLDVI